jgi:O-antigen/teichoic acid export membrane protein
VSVKRHAGYNLIGAVIPIALALLTVPLYLRLVGPDRYGVLAIAWLLLGYFGLFDLGLGRATSFRISALRDAAPQDRAATFWSALSVNAAMGLVGGIIFWLAADYFFAHVFKVKASLRAEILTGVPILAAAVPVATITGVLTGALQGREKFLETNMVSVISTTLFQLLPLGVAWWHGPNLTPLLVAAISARLVAVLVLGVRCYAELGRGYPVRMSPGEIPVLLKYGGWVSLTSLFGPMLVIVDRFAIGAILGATAVAVYTVPFQLAQRIAILPSSLTNALFPRMSAGDSDTRALLAQRATRTLAGMVSPLVLAGVLGLEPFLHIWVGADMAVQAAPVGRVLLVGFWANAFALIPFTRLQASGRPDLVTKMLLLQIPPYLLGLYLGMTYFGLLGCALAFSTRCVADYLLLSLAAGRKLQEPLRLSIIFGLLVVAAWMGPMGGLLDPRFCAAALVLSGAMLAISWQSVPSDLRGRALQRLPLIWRGA